MEWRVTGTFGGQDVDLTITGIGTSPPKRTPGVKVSSMSDSDVSDAIARCRENLAPSVVAAADNLVEVFASSNKTGQVAASRLLREVWEPLVKARDSFTDAALVYGLDAAVRKGAASVNYAKKAARSFDEPAAEVVPVVRRRVIGAPNHG